MQLKIPNHTNRSFKSNSNGAYWRYFGRSHVQILTQLYCHDTASSRLNYGTTNHWLQQFTQTARFLVPQICDIEGRWVFILYLLGKTLY